MQVCMCSVQFSTGACYSDVTYCSNLGKQTCGIDIQSVSSHNCGELCTLTLACGESNGSHEIITQQQSNE